MKCKKWIATALVLCMCLSLAACGSGEPVYVQRVLDLLGSGMVTGGDRFAGMVVAENVIKIQKDGDKQVEELLVAEGDNVTQDQPLFTYDTDELQLTLDKQKLEQEQLNANIASFQDQIVELERQSKLASQKDQLRYTVEIQSMQVQLKEAQMNLESKKKDIEKSQQLLENTTVTSPVNGRVQSIADSSDSGNSTDAYMVIQQEGSFRVEGSLGEMQRGGLQEGARMKITSRTSPNQVWYGTVISVDYNNPSQGSGNGDFMIDGGSPLTQASRYPFYVELDNTDDLLLGQHVYMEVDTDGGSGLMIGGAFVCYDGDGGAYVWAERKGKLEKRSITLGEYHEISDAYAVVSGLKGDDYIAFPDESCKEGAPTTREAPVQSKPEEQPDLEGGVE